MRPHGAAYRSGTSDHYDDGGSSSGTLERPVLKCLLADTRDGKVQKIIFCKIDWLSRSSSTSSGSPRFFAAARNPGLGLEAQSVGFRNEEIR